MNQQNGKGVSGLEHRQKSKYRFLLIAQKEFLYVGSKLHKSFIVQKNPALYEFQLDFFLKSPALIVDVHMHEESIAHTFIHIFKGLGSERV